jgi:hypothetical protein
MTRTISNDLAHVRKAIQVLVCAAAALFLAGLGFERSKYPVP